MKGTNVDQYYEYLRTRKEVYMEGMVPYYSDLICKAGFERPTHLIANLFMAFKGVDGYYVVIGKNRLFTYKYESQITFEEIDNGTISS